MPGDKAGLFVASAPCILFPLCTGLLSSPWISQPKCPVKGAENVELQILSSGRKPVNVRSQPHRCSHQSTAGKATDPCTADFHCYLCSRAVIGYLLVFSGQRYYSRTSRLTQTARNRTTDGASSVQRTVHPAHPGASSRWPARPHQSPGSRPHFAHQSCRLQKRGEAIGQAASCPPSGTTNM